MRDAGDDFNNYPKPRKPRVETPKNDTDSDVDEIVNLDGTVDKV